MQWNCWPDVWNNTPLKTSCQHSFYAMSMLPRSIENLVSPLRKIYTSPVTTLVYFSPSNPTTTITTHAEWILRIWPIFLPYECETNSLKKNTILSIRKNEARKTNAFQQLPDLCAVVCVYPGALAPLFTQLAPFSLCLPSTLSYAMPCSAWSQPGSQPRKDPEAATSTPRHCWPMPLPWQVTRKRGEKSSSHLMRKP